jgi:hypothetical protein
MVPNSCLLGNPLILLGNPLGLSARRSFSAFTAEDAEGAEKLEIVDDALDAVAEA